MSEMVHATYGVQNQLLVHAQEGAWVDITKSHPDVHTQDCIQRTCAHACALFQMCTSGYTPPSEKNKNTQMGTYRHIRPQMSTQDTSTLAVCTHVHPLPATYSSLYSPKM